MREIRVSGVSSDLDDLYKYIIEEQFGSVFYISFNKDDVEEAIRMEPEIAKELGVEIVYFVLQDVYAAVYD